MNLMQGILPEVYVSVCLYGGSIYDIINLYDYVPEKEEAPCAVSA